MRHVFIVALSLLLGACLGGGGGGESPATTAGSGATVATAPASPTGSTATAPPATTQPPASSSGTTSAPSGTSGNAIYERTPLVTSCDGGMLKLAEKQAVLAELNAIRALHRLPPVAYDSSADVYVQKSALIGVANAELTHAPSTAVYCYSTEGAQGSAESNLYLASGFTPPSTASVGAFLVDDNVPGLGHRRWVLHPFLSATAFGRVDGRPFNGRAVDYTAMSLKVIGSSSTNLAGSSLEYVAYPEGDYPARYFRHGWFQSFSVIADKTRASANGSSAIDFSAASVSVTDQNGAAMAVSDLRYNYNGYGLPNVIQWKAAGTADAVRYSVRIANVRVNGQSRDYSYAFRIL